MNELVSIIMSVYNEKEEWLCESIESVLNQTYNKLEYIIVLDNPDNISLKTRIEEYAKQDTRIKLIINPTNMGLVRSMNRALEYVTGNFVARMDADDICYVDRIEKELACVEKYNVDFVMTCADYILEDGMLQNGEEWKTVNSKEMRKLLYYGHPSIHSTWFLRKEIYEKLVGYREVKYAEDVDFLLRAVQEGYSCFKMKEHTIQYRIRTEGISKTYALEQYKKAKYIRKLYRKKILLKNIDPIELNEKYANLGEEEKMNYANADRIMDMFCERLRDKHTIQAIWQLLKGVFSNYYCRELFVRNMRYRIHLALMR